MPVIRLFAKPEWLPVTGPAIHIPSGYQFQLTYGLVNDLPEIVINAVNEVDSSTLTPGQGVVFPGHIHPWAVNAVDMWIDVQPDDIDGTYEERQARRFKIASLIREGVEEYFGQREVRPSFDVECRPMDGSGMSISASGVAVMQWGAPDGVSIVDTSDSEPAEDGEEVGRKCSRGVFKPPTGPLTRQEADQADEKDPDAWDPMTGKRPSDPVNWGWVGPR